MNYIDLSHTIEDGLVTYKGLPAPIICDYWSRESSKELYEDGSSFHIAKVELVSNTGTYLDCPFHRYEDGKDLSELTIAAMADLEIVVIHADYHQVGLSIGIESFKGHDLEGKAVLIQTNWDEHWNTEHYYTDHPYLTEEVANYLKQEKVKLVGIDSYNVDNAHLPKRPIHSILLGAGILIVEHLCNLKQLPVDKKLTFTAMPPKIKGVGTFPVRAYAKIND